ncbi:MAG TPA: hypothetical protein VHD57_14040 [Vicinamibacterales bacterium]|jgi:hypothetical protein|nr:hypothetical protein [Vicinamibacterales bacterium]
MSDTLQIVVVTLAAVIALAVIVRPYLPGRRRASNGVGASLTPTCAKCAASHARPASVRSTTSTVAPRSTASPSSRVVRG